MIFRVFYERAIVVFFSYLDLHIRLGVNTKMLLIINSEIVSFE